MPRPSNLSDLLDDSDGLDDSPLPSNVVDTYGKIVDLTGGVWILNVLDAKDTLDWRRYEGFASPELVIAAKHWLCDSIERLSPATARARFEGLLTCLRKFELLGLRVEWMTPVYFEKLRAVLAPFGAAILHQYNYPRLFYYWCADNYIAGASQSVADQIGRMKLRNDMYRPEAVMSMDPEDGPLTFEEITLLDRMLAGIENHHLASVCVMLSYELGCNPLNFCLLECRDLKRYGANSEPVYQLDIPRIKKRTRLRAELKRRPISSKLGKAIEALIASDAARFGCVDPKRPVLCRACPRERWVSTPRDELKFHLTPREFWICFGRFTREFPILSPRTREVLALTPRRMRYSFAQRMAELGTPSTELAMLMDHSDRQTVMVYYQNSSKVAKRIDSAMEKTAGPVWHWFVGGAPKIRLPTNFEVHATTSTLRDLGGVGECGAELICSLNPPYSCYVCPKFQPWVDGPHEQFLQEVRKEQDRLRAFADNHPGYPIPRAIEEVALATEELVANIRKRNCQ